MTSIDYKPGAPNPIPDERNFAGLGMARGALPEDYSQQAAMRQQNQAALQGAVTGASALDVQVGGGHYKQKKIQPVEFISANNLNFLEGCIVKRITRWRDKNGIEDLQKIKHEVDLLIEMEKRYGNNAGK